MLGALVNFTGSEERILYQGEPINLLLAEGMKNWHFYSTVCGILPCVISFVMHSWKITHKSSRFNAGIILVIMLILVFTVFPIVVEKILPDIEIGRFGRYALGILPLVMYVEGQVKRAREGGAP